MKRNLLFILPICLLSSFLVYWLLFSNATSFKSNSTQLVIIETDKATILQQMMDSGIINNKISFELVASTIGTWANLKPGKYLFNKGMGNLLVARILKNSKQVSTKLVINKLRTKQDLAKLIAKNFQTDSSTVMQFLQSNDSLAPYQVDTHTVFTLILPDTYFYYWNTPFSKILSKLSANAKQFWDSNERKDKLAKLGLTKEAVYTLASIVEEETNYRSDQSKIASVYLNRLNKNMALQACPTIKFAMQDFGLTRIYLKYLSHPSPYNTYRVKGLPPGPICTPSAKTIDLVLDAPKTDYLFFVAKADFSGYHHFSSNFAEHNRFAKEYQLALDKYMARKK